MFITSNTGHISEPVLSTVHVTWNLYFHLLLILSSDTFQRISQSACVLCSPVSNEWPASCNLQHFILMTVPRDLHESWGLSCDVPKVNYVLLHRSECSQHALWLIHSCGTSVPAWKCTVSCLHIVFVFLRTYRAVVLNSYLSSWIRVLPEKLKDP